MNAEIGREANRRTVFKGRRPPIRWDDETPDEILRYLRDLAKQSGKDTVTTRDVKKDGRISPATIFRRFGGFSEALIQAGLRPTRTYKRNRNSMLKELSVLIKTLGRVPSKTEVRRNLSYGVGHFEKEFGSLEKAAALAESLQGAEQKPPGMELRTAQAPLARSKTRRRYGAALDFRGLRHAPINELGVVFLFGMFAEQLGFVVESIQEGFPDCDAKRRLTDGTFEGVRIEFEFRSREFRRHRHDPNGCDIIVCWLHDWGECPIEVIELSKVIESSKTKKEST
jgi:hypothetical protein